MKSLEEAIQRFNETCERCQKKLTVHAFRQKSHLKKEAVYCHCIDKTCAKYQAEICFLK